LQAVFDAVQAAFVQSAADVAEKELGLFVREYFAQRLADQQRGG